MDKHREHYCTPQNLQHDKKLDYCRTCDHIHYDGVVCNVFGTCFCEKLIPHDNLEYLEWKYESKHLYK